MKTLATLLAALSLATNLSAQTKLFTDPANLGGERVKPRDGRELPVDQGTSGLQQMLRRLNTRASILNIVAHPDDEDGGMMTLYSRGMGARVADLSLTRGEGGQNAMTGDFEDALGLLRTQELLSCDRYSGVDQFFGTEVDFGFSKTKQEAFAKWGHDRVLYDVVRAIRIYRPLVLTATFIGGVTDGHGQHQVSGEIAQEAFKAAGDPKVFPELTAEGILPWQPLRIYARVPQQAISDKGLFDYATGQYMKPHFVNYVTGEVSATPPSTDIVLHEGETDPLLSAADGKPQTYVQFARIGLGQQKSQIGPGFRMPGAGKFDVAYHRYGSMLPTDKQNREETSFFDGMDTSIRGLASLLPNAPDAVTNRLDAIDNRLREAQNAFSPQPPEACAPALTEALRTLDLLIASINKMTSAPADARYNILHELRVKHSQLNDALVLALGITMEARPDKPTQPVVSGEPFVVHVALKTTAARSLPAPDYGMHFMLQGSAEPDSGHDEPQAMRTDDGWTATFQVRSTLRTETRPYFHRASIERPFYDVDDKRLRNAPATPPALVAIAAFDYNGVGLNVAHTVNVLHTYAGGGSVSEPAQVVPPVNLKLGTNTNAVPRTEHGFSDPVLLQNVGTHPLQGSFRLAPPPGWAIDSPILPFAAVPPGQTMETAVKLHSQPDTVRTGPLNMSDQLFVAVRSDDGKTYSEGFRPVGYPGLISTNYFTPATDRIVSVDLKLPGRLRIGYLPGTGDAVPEALASIGLQPTMLTVADLTADKLKPFDTVILGVRTYAAHPELHGAPTQALLDYARSGGNVVVQYQTAEFTGDDAPYPLTLGRDAEKVVDETAPVELLDPASPLLSSPNTITPADFNNWVEERGHGFLGTWDAHYTALTETHDPGAPAEGVQPQEPQRGGLVTVQLGKGRWTYLAFAVYRQLPQAVPGAFRLFVDLLQK